MPRGSKLLDEPQLLTNPETGKTRTVVSKVDKVTAEAAGFVGADKLRDSIPPAERSDEVAATIRSAAAQKAAATRAAKKAAAKSVEKPVEKPTETPTDGPDAAVDSPLTPGTTETPGADTAVDTTDAPSV